MSITVHNYSPDNLLLSLKMIAPEVEGDALVVRNETVYEYDSQGRITKETFYDTNKTKTEKVYDYSRVVYTQDGYIFEGNEYTLDSQGRLIRIQT